jgi:hypothetical protein
MAKHGIGASVLRKEDDRFLRGRGQYVGDIRLVGTREVAFVRSPVAHARLQLADAAATRGRTVTALQPSDILIAPLNRPSYYLKPREGKPSLESWLNPRMLYRIPRSQQTTGVRALGRLAFCDNYRGLQRRLHAELEAILELNVRASRKDKDGLREPPLQNVVCIPFLLF